MKIFISMAGEGKGRQAVFVNFYTEFFVKFANESRFRRLVNFDLAPREFPQSREAFSLGTLRQKNTAIHVNQSTGRNKNYFSHLNAPQNGADLQGNVNQLPKKRLESYRYI